MDVDAAGLADGEGAAEEEGDAGEGEVAGLDVVDIGSRSEHKSVMQKIPRLPPSIHDALLDGGYDGNAPAEALEYECQRQADPKTLCLSSDLSMRQAGRGKMRASRQTGATAIASQEAPGVFRQPEGAQPL